MWAIGISQFYVESFVQRLVQEVARCHKLFEVIVFNNTILLHTTAFQISVAQLGSIIFGPWIYQQLWWRSIWAEVVKSNAQVGDGLRGLGGCTALSAKLQGASTGFVGNQESNVNQYFLPDL